MSTSAIPREEAHPSTSFTSCGTPRTRARSPTPSTSRRRRSSSPDRRVFTNERTLMAATDRTREVRGPTSWVILAGVMMVLVGFLNFFYGLAAIVNDEVVVVGGHGAIIADLTAW